MKSEEIVDFVTEIFQLLRLYPGAGERVISIAGISKSKKGDLCWLSSKKSLSENFRGSFLIAGPDFIQSNLHPVHTVVCCKNPRLAFIRVFWKFFSQMANDNLPWGFGYERDETGKLCRFPHVGGIVFGDDVDVGQNVCIDRGSLGDTIIHRGVKIDNLVHIAHNAEIGEDTVIVAHAMIGGSAKIGKRCWIGPGALIMNGITIGDDCVIGMGAVVLKDVPANSVMVGNPAKFLRKNK